MNNIKKLDWMVEPKKNTNSPKKSLIEEMSELETAIFNCGHYDLINDWENYSETLLATFDKNPDKEYKNGEEILSPSWEDLSDDEIQPAISYAKSLLYSADLAQEQLPPSLRESINNRTVKNYETFVNEELKTETYLSAADKLKSKGHKNRANKLREYGESMTKKVQPISIELYGQKYNLTDENVVVFKDGKNKDYINITLVFDRKKYDLMVSENYKKLWDLLLKKDKDDFHNEYKGLFDEEEWEEKILKGEALNDWDDMSEDEKSFFEEWISMNILMIGFSSFDDNDIEVDGLVIKDRKVAFKLMKFIKEYANLYGGKIKERFQNLTVNDLYSN